MRREPTATAISSNLYLDKHSPTSIASGTPVIDNISSLNSNSVAFSKGASNSPVISPAFTRPHLGNQVNGYATAPLIQRNDYNGKSINSKSSVSTHHDCSKSSSMGRYLKHHKLRKKNKREMNPQLNNHDSAPNVHSLKVTIRRTYKSNKAETGVCTIVNNSDDHESALKPSDSNAESTAVPMDVADEAMMTVAFGGTMKSENSTLTPIYTPVTSTVESAVDMATSTTDSATLTEPDMLGPCEPGTKLVVEGVVWLETQGMLVLNIQWRGRNYMGTLLDAPKQTFAPTCTDKGIVSALSLLRGRKSWSHCSPPIGSYRTRGLHHFHHHHHCRQFHHHQYHHRHGATFGLSGSMTTRSAAAAAAAASTSKDASSSGQTKEASDDEHDNAGQTKIDEGTSSTSSFRGGCKRRRRGTGRKPYHSFDLSLIDETRSTDDAIKDSDVAHSSPLHDHQLDAPLVLECPYADCSKRFADMLGLRYHLSLGHVSSQLDTNDAGCDDDDDGDEEDEEDDDRKSALAFSPPPKLARAHNFKDRGSDSNDASFVTPNTDDVDDNLDPPKLHRVVSIPDSNFPYLDSKHTTTDADHSIDIIHDDPPAPSPAYSDISDDTTEPLLSIPAPTQLFKPSFAYSHSPSLMNNIVNGLKLPSTVFSSPNPPPPPLPSSLSTSSSSSSSSSFANTNNHQLLNVNKLVYPTPLSDSGGGGAVQTSDLHKQLVDPLLKYHGAADHVKPVLSWDRDGSLSRVESSVPAAVGSKPAAAVNFSTNVFPTTLKIPLHSELTKLPSASHMLFESCKRCD